MHGAAFGALAGIALILFFFYLFYGFLHRAFQSVGFSQGEATAILLGTIVLGFVNLPLVAVGEWRLAINFGGAVVPVVVSYVLLRRASNLILEAIVGITLVAVVSYLVTTVTPEGIVSPFPLWLAPPLVAALVSLVSFWREESHAAPLAYISGSLGTLIGGDLFRISDFLAQTAPAPGTIASIGGAQIFDMVFLAGVLAVGLDVIVFSQLRKAGVFDNDGSVVFRVGTSTEAIRDYDPAAEQRARPPRVRPGAPPNVRPPGRRGS